MGRQGPEQQSGAQKFRRGDEELDPKRPWFPMLIFKQSQPALLRDIASVPNGRSGNLECGCSRLIGAYSHSPFQWRYKNFAVADLSRVRDLADDFDNLVDHRVVHSGL